MEANPQLARWESELQDVTSILRAETAELMAGHTYVYAGEDNYSYHNMVHLSGHLYLQESIKGSQVLLRSAQHAEIVGGVVRDIDPIDIHIITNQLADYDNPDRPEVRQLVMCREYRLNSDIATFDTGIIFLDEDNVAMPGSYGHFINIKDGKFNWEVLNGTGARLSGLDASLWVDSPTEPRFSRDVCREMLSIVRELKDLRQS